MRNLSVILLKFVISRFELEAVNDTKTRAGKCGTIAIKIFSLDPARAPDWPLQTSGMLCGIKNLLYNIQGTKYVRLSMSFIAV